MASDIADDGGGPSANGANGANDFRDGLGRFTKGNPGGPGNPHASMAMRHRQAIAIAATPERTKAVMDALFECATTGGVGQVQAIKEWLQRTAGTPEALEFTRVVEELELKVSELTAKSLGAPWRAKSA